MYGEYINTLNWPYLYLTNLKIDLILIKPEINAQIPQKTTIIPKLIIQFAVKDLDNILKIIMPAIKTKIDKINLTFTLNLNIL